MRFLIVEDDPVIAGYIVNELGERGFEQDHVLTGAAAIRALGQRDYSALVLDRMLPDISGFAVIEALRAAGYALPVMILSALGTVKDRIEGLEHGADDYLAKPFDMAELCARLNALARRADGKVKGRNLGVGQLQLDASSHSVTFRDVKIELNRKQFSMLAYMMSHTDRVITRAMLLEHVWGYAFEPSTNIIESNLSRLRGRLLQLGIDPIETMRGTGYILRSERCA